MSFLSYRAVPMSIVHTRRVRREVLSSRDGMVYHGTRWTFDVDCVFNPAATAYQQTGAPQGVAVGGAVLPVAPTNVNTAGLGRPAASARPGTLPVFTDASLRHWLSQPRGQLIYGAGGTVLLQCPGPGYASDLTGTGPNVTVNNVTYLWENHTFVVSLKVVAVVNESRKTGLDKAISEGGLGFPVLLSNVWRQTSDCDADHFVTLTTQGVATFRMDELARRGRVPDQYRYYVAPNSPQNFTRGPLRWSVEGDTLTYEVTDTEQAFNVPAHWKATRLEVYETRQMVQPHLGSALATGLSYALQPSPTPLGEYEQRIQGPGRAARARAVAFNTALTVARLAFPVVVRSAVARAWGNRDTRRGFLADLVVGACLNRIGQRVTANIVGDTTQARLTQECSGKMVEFELTHTRVWVPFNPLGYNNALAVDGQTPDSPFDAVTRIRVNDDTPGYLQRANAMNLQPPNSPTPANPSSGTRGTYRSPLHASSPPLPAAEGLPGSAPVPVTNLAAADVDVPIS